MDPGRGAGRGWRSQSQAGHSACGNGSTAGQPLTSADSGRRCIGRPGVGQRARRRCTCLWVSRCRAAAQPAHGRWTGGCMICAASPCMPRLPRAGSQSSGHRGRGASKISVSSACTHAPGPAWPVAGSLFSSSSPRTLVHHTTAPRATATHLPRNSFIQCACAPRIRLLPSQYPPTEPPITLTPWPLQRSSSSSPATRSPRSVVPQLARAAAPDSPAFLS